MASNTEKKNNDLASTPYGYTLSVIGGKWKMILLYLLYDHKVVRYNELQRLAGGITYKTLSVQLKELEADGLILRKEYPQIPPKVEYSITEKGRSLAQILELMCEWGEKNMDERFELTDPQCTGQEEE